MDVDDTSMVNMDGVLAPAPETPKSKKAKPKPEIVTSGQSVAGNKPSKAVAPKGKKAPKPKATKPKKARPPKKPNKPVPVKSKKAAKPKTKKPAAKKKAKAVPAVIGRTERMDLRLSKKEKAMVKRVSAKHRRTVTSLFVQFAERLDK